MKTQLNGLPKTVANSDTKVKMKKVKIGSEADTVLWLNLFIFICSNFDYIKGIHKGKILLNLLPAPFPGHSPDQNCEEMGLQSPHHHSKHRTV